MNQSAAETIDVNVSLGRWPFARIGHESADDLLKQLDRHGVDQAWVGNLEGVFHRDLAAVNDRLAEQCSKSGDRLLPFGSINPTLPDWKTDIQRCHERHGMHGLRVHPAYHGYTLDRPEFREMLIEASQRRLIVQVVAVLEDERTQPVMFRLPRLDLGRLHDLVREITALRLHLLNAFRNLSSGEAVRLAATGRVWFDTATLEGVDGLARLIDQVGPACLTLGSHWPLFHQQAALLKLRESSLPESVLLRVRGLNAVNLLAAEEG